MNERKKYLEAHSDTMQQKSEPFSFINTVADM